MGAARLHFGSTEMCKTAPPRGKSAPQPMPSSSSRSKSSTEPSAGSSLAPFKGCSLPSKFMQPFLFFRPPTNADMHDRRNPILPLPRDFRRLGTVGRNSQQSKARRGPRERARPSHWAGVRWKVTGIQPEAPRTLGTFWKFTNACATTAEMCVVERLQSITSATAHLFGAGALFCSLVLLATHTAPAAPTNSDLFPQQQLVTLHITIPAQGTASLDKNPRTDVAAVVQEGTQTWTNVLLHLKGSTGRFR